MINSQGNDVFALDLDELVKNAPVATDLNKVVESIRKEANNCLVDYARLKRESEVAEVMQQVIEVGSSYKI